MHSRQVLASCALALGALLSARLGAQTLLHEYTGASPHDLFGFALDAADLDGDGVADLIIGAPQDDIGAINAGRVTVRSGATGVQIRSWRGVGSNDGFGAALAVVGDINGDGVADVLIGAPAADASGPGLSGVAYLYSGATGLLIRSHQGALGWDGFGSSLGGVGDVTGDGVPDYAIGAETIFDESFPDGFTDAPAQLYSGSDGALLPGSDIMAGKFFRAAGDVNGDGNADYLCSRTDFAFGHPQAQLRTGPAQGVLDTVTVTAGVAVAAPMADLNGDGLPDYAMAFSPWAGPQSLQIRSAVAGTLLASTAIPPDVATGGLITVLDGRADLNGDGVPDLIVGLPASDALGLNAGEALVLSGSDLSELVRLQGTKDRGDFGAQVIVLGDLDGDGISDYAVSETSFDNILNSVSGVVRVYSGGALGWKNLGLPLAGAGGNPSLTGTGFLLPGHAVALALDHAAASAPAGLVIGLSYVHAPLLGGVLGPSPDVIVAGLGTSVAGTLALGAAWPVGLPPALTTWFQVWIKDASAPHGWAASNTISGTNAP